MLEDKDDLMTCSLSYTFSAISGKWKPFIIWYLHASSPNPVRYGDLKRKIPWNISHKMFAQQLQELENANIICRQEYQEKVPRVEYSLTEAGKLLAPAILFLRDWGAVFGDRFDRHALLDRTHGTKDANGNDILAYGYHSDELNKEVDISFHY